jgi:hypothetical protein
VQEIHPDRGSAGTLSAEYPNVRLWNCSRAKSRQRPSGLGYLDRFLSKSRKIVGEDVKRHVLWLNVCVYESLPLCLKGST